MKTLGKSIKALREREKMSQADLARKLEVHKNLTYRWESGISMPHPDHIERLCELFGVDEYTLFCYRGDCPHIFELLATFPSLSKSQQHQILGLMHKFSEETAEKK